MQIFYPDAPTAVILCFALWAVFQLSAALICYLLPDSKFDHDSCIYRIRGFEQKGSLYKKYFAVHKWKKYLPDGGIVFNGGYSKKHLIGLSENDLNKYLIESRRGELTHWLAIIPFWVFGFFAPPYIIPIMFVYAVAINMPCIITQRYNRPRIGSFIRKMHIDSDVRLTYTSDNNKIR